MHIFGLQCISQRFILNCVKVGFSIRMKTFRKVHEKAVKFNEALAKVEVLNIVLVRS